MVELYVALIIKGAKNVNQVPASIRQKVKDMLVDVGLEDLVDSKE